MKVYELINILQECNQMATIVTTVNLSWEPGEKDVKVIPQDTESRRTAKEIELAL